MTAHRIQPVQGWRGAYRSYDLLKEIVVAAALVTTLVALLAVLFGQPERSAVTFQEWATNDPKGFLTTTLDELSGTSGTAQYGPPYTNAADASQSIFGVSPQRLAGETVPTDTAESMVLHPLETLATSEVASAIARYRAADTQSRSVWEDAYRSALAGSPEMTDTIEAPDAGPLPAMLDSMLGLARSGAVDAALVDGGTQSPGFFVLDYTRSQLYLADGDYFANLGRQAGLAGDQWGMAATLDNWPGQVWLLPVSFWYQIPPANASDSGDLIVLSIVEVLGFALIFLPFIPGLRDVPRRIGLYRLIWGRYYRDTRLRADTRALEEAHR